MMSWSIPLVALGFSAAASTPTEAPPVASTQAAPGQRAPAPSTPEAPQPVALAYQPKDCDPEKALRCTCVGSVGSAEAALKEIGLDAQTLRTSGAPCIQGDFDRDGNPDYAFPGASYGACNGAAPVRVIFTKKGLVREVQSLPREMSCFQLYRPNKKPGRDGVPATKRDALVDWGEGNATWFYRHDGKRWLATSHASEAN
ncbi:hypothetical protein [Pyxidicoccus caerfyrddinensis]|uniref:hypothetical protein n=1 Tax=Pyxidicoccus caerfyrddinensis TaxID=2709663 RepID=UPI0013DA0844|nr:hypothetical protein [Pyxidicoccus caerfyrddinensis]